MSDIYQPNSVFQPSQVVSSAPVWGEISKVAEDTKDKVFNYEMGVKSAKIQNNKYQSSAKISEALNKTYINSLQYSDPNARAAYYKQAVDKLKPELFQGVMPENVGYASSIFDHLHDKYSLDNMKDVATRNTQIIKEKHLETFNQYQNQTINTLRAGDTKRGSVWLGQSNAMLDDMINSGASASTISSMRIGLNKSAYQSAAIGQYEIAVKNGQGKQFKENFDKLTNYGKGFEHVNQFLSPQDKASVVSEFSKIDKQRAIELGVAGEKGKQALEENIFSAERTGNVNEFEVNQLAEVSENPDSVFQKINEAKKVYSNRTDANSGTFQHLNDAVASYKSLASNTKDFGVHNITNRTLNYLEKDQKLATTDPAEYLSRQPQYQSFLKKDLANLGSNHYTSLLNYEKQNGYPIKLLSNQTKRDWITPIHGLPPISAALALNEHLKTIPLEARPYIQAQLESGTTKNPGLNKGIVQSADQIKNNHDNAPEIAKAMEKQKLSEFPLVNNGTLTTSEIDKSYAGKVDDDNMTKVMSNNPDGRFENINAHVDMVKKVAVQSMEDNKYNNIDDAMAAAIKTVNAGHNYHTWGNNGYTFSTPNGTSHIRTLAIMGKVKDELKVSKPINLFSSEFDRDQNVAADSKYQGITLPKSLINQYPTYNKHSLANIMVSNSHWINYKGKKTTDDDGLMLVYTDGRGNTTPIIHNDSTVLIRFKKINEGGFLKTFESIHGAVSELL